LGIADKMNVGFVTIFGLPLVHIGISPQSNDSFISSAFAIVENINIKIVIKNFFIVNPLYCLEQFIITKIEKKDQII
jgi:hypothetical protein